MQVLVNKVLPLSSTSGALHQRDVLLAYNGEPIGCDGTVHFRGHERTSFDYLVTGGVCALILSALAMH